MIYRAVNAIKYENRAIRGMIKDLGGGFLFVLLFT